MKVIARLMMASVIAGVAAPAFAADLSSAAAPVAPPPAAPSYLNSLSLEVSPEFVLAAPGSAAANSIADGYIKGAYSRSLGAGWSWGASLQFTERTPSGSVNRYQWQPETTLGYTWKLDPTWSIPLSAGVGYLYNNVPYLHDGTASFAYYVVNAGLNMKLDSHWTWNAISARYRNAFEGEWVTPKVATGVTYTIDPANAVYANFGYAWQSNYNAGQDGAVEPSKWNVALGYKRSF